METVKFKRWDGERPYVYTFWPDGELRMFKDEASASRWADQRGLKAKFEHCDPVATADSNAGAE